MNCVMPSPKEIHAGLTVIDGLQYSNWDRALLEELKAGGIDAVHATIVYWEDARQTLTLLADWNRRFREHADLIRPARSGDDIRAAKKERRIAIVFGAQNCTPIEQDLGLVEVFRSLGLMVMQLTYNNQSPLGTGCYEATDSGLTRFGREVVREMNRVGMIVDLSHTAETTTLETIAFSKRPVCISHANPNFFHQSVRNKSDKVLKALAESGGMLGFSLYPLHIGGAFCTLEAFTGMVARTAELMGVEHIGIGSDTVRGWSDSVLDWMRSGRWSWSSAKPSWPDWQSWYRTPADFGNLTAGLLARGFSAKDVARIMGGNWLDFMDAGFRLSAFQ
jgi:microsomal dipeptidase-like Zn-dependent dipeptidase